MSSSLMPLGQLGGGEGRIIIVILFLQLEEGTTSKIEIFNRVLTAAGPKEWLKEQKKKTADFLLAPIAASHDRLYSAYHLLKTGEISFNKEYEEAQRLVKVAARDCIPPEEGSFVAFQASTGVEIIKTKRQVSVMLSDSFHAVQSTNQSKTSSFMSLIGVMRWTIISKFQVLMRNA
eukprot:Gb_18764 [translate_table: standard]